MMLSEKKNFFFFLRRLARSVGIIGKSNFLRLAPKRTGESGARKLPALTIMIVGHQGRPFERGDPEIQVQIRKRVTARLGPKGSGGQIVKRHSHFGRIIEPY